MAISAGASGNRIGTDGKSVDDAGERNVIGGSWEDGIDIYGTGTDGNVVAGNFIGTDVTGTVSLGIFNDGVFLAEGASSNWIGVNPSGGPAIHDEGNVISGNEVDGVQIYDSSSFNVVAGNKIGTDVTGTVALGNGANGVEVDAGCPGNTIGGAATGTGNVISANSNYGVWITGNGATGSLVAGNQIGTDITGTVAQGNANTGVQIDSGAADNTIGGTSSGSGNLIANNQGPGVGVVGVSLGNQITANRIFANSGPAIDLGDDGPTYNSAARRVGPNNLQNYPIIVDDC